MNKASRSTAAVLAGALLLAVTAAGPVCAAGHAADVDAAHKLFAKCRICHAVAAGAPSTVGPNLHGVFGRKAGSLPDFAYSSAMTASGVIWGDDTLSKYLRDPKAFIPGNRMAFPGIVDKAMLSDLIAYLEQATR